MKNLFLHTIKLLGIATIACLTLSSCHSKINENVDNLNNEIGLPFEYYGNRVELGTSGSDVELTITVNEGMLDEFKETQDGKYVFKELREELDEDNYGKHQAANIKYAKEFCNVLAEEGSDIRIEVETKSGLKIGEITLQSDAIQLINDEINK